MFWPLAKKMCRPLREPLPKTDLAAAAVAFGGSLHVAGFVDGSVHLWHWRKKTEVRAGVFFFRAQAVEWPVRKYRCVA